MKEQFIDLLEEYLIPYIDCGTYVNKPCDYYDYVSQSAQLINNNDCDFGVSFCRSGQGVNISANKAGLISALCFDEFTAEMAVRHNCANHFAVPSKYVDKEMMRKMIQIWCTTSFDGGRHFTRLNKVLK